MSFDYEKLKSRNDASSGEHWTSNSDLFMVLSVVFLLLYVVASVRNGASAITKAIKVQELKNQKEDLARQLRAYNTLKEDYLKNEAKEQELSMYQDLMKNLELLQSEAERKRRELERKAQKNVETKQALNQYQQMVRNIINTNLLAKKRIKKRDRVIVEKKTIITDQESEIQNLDETIKSQAVDIKQKSHAIASAQKQISKQEQEILERQKDLEAKRKEISSLEGDLYNKKKEIAQNNAQINSLNQNLENKILALKKEAADKKKTQQEMRAEVLKLRLANQKKVNSLKEESESMQSKLKGLEGEITDANRRILAANETLAQKEREQEMLEAKYKQAAANYQNQIKNMESDFEAKISKQRADLNAQLSAEKASAEEKSRRLAAFKAQADQERAQLEGALDDLEGKVSEAKKALGDMEKKASEYEDKLEKAKKDHDRYLASLKDLEKENKDLSGDLGRYKEMVEAKKNLAKKLKDKLREKGIQAIVDDKTGDVTINFGNEYFDSGSAKLKPGMIEILKKFVPEYAHTLFSESSVAEKIKNVEIVGFSSPTYRGKYVDPNSLKKEDRAALNYNLDLSFRRAKSIFSYMTDTSRLKFQYQKTITPMTKVTGRSYLAEGVQGRNLASGISRKKYCAKYDCLKSQKVIIRFNLKD